MGNPGCVLVFERLRKIKAKGVSTSRRLNRKQANQLNGKINQLAKEKAYAIGVVSVEVNPHGTSQYCARGASQRDEVQPGGEATDHGQRGQALLLFLVPLRVSCRLQRQRQCPS